MALFCRIALSAILLAGFGAMLYSMTFQDSADTASQLIPPTPTPVLNLSGWWYWPGEDEDVWGDGSELQRGGGGNALTGLPDDPVEGSDKMQDYRHRKHQSDIAQVAHEDDVPD